ncbi:general stress protein [Corynebacterium coyleae]|nr:general stress protein [Corynebacterium coyleae]
MTQPMNPSLNKALGATEVPTGWPVGSFTTYAEAQRAVDNLSDREFPVEKLSIVGVDLMQVEKITGRLTWPKVLGTGALSGLWMGLFFGLLLSLISVPGAGLSMFVWAIVIGAIFGAVASAVAYAFTGGKRDFASATTIVAGRYDVLCEPDAAPQARDMIAQAGGRTPGSDNVIGE